MSVSFKSRKLLSVAMAVGLTVALTAGPAAAAVTGLTLTPPSDTAPAGTCNAFTITLTGATQTDITGQTVDVEVRDTDADDPDTRADDSETPVNFCKPSEGPNPQRAVEDENTTLNEDGDCEVGTIPMTPGDPPGCDGTISGEVGSTDSAGQVTFGIRSDGLGNYSVRAYYDANDNDTIDTGEPSDTSLKEFIEPVGQPQCSDSADNDADGLVDYPNDPGCAAATDNDETDGGSSVPPSQCQDGVDNDGDGLTDYGTDGGCTAPSDNDETGSGNRRLQTRVSIRYKDSIKSFKGSVRAGHTKCVANRRVVLKRKVKGADFVVAKGFTNNRGVYKLKKRRVEGKTWYVVARPKQFPRANGGTVFCLKGRSSDLTVS